MLTLNSKELHELIANERENLELIDVRRLEEYNEGHISGVKLITLHLLPQRTGEIDTTKKIVFICRSGNRSGQACGYFAEKGITSYNLVDGMIGFEKEFPLEIIRENKT